MRKFVKDFVREEDAVGVIELILILIVLIGLVLIFKGQLTTLVEKLLSRIASKSKTV